MTFLTAMGLVFSFTAGQGKAPATAPASPCVDAAITNVGVLNDVLSMRLVDIFRRARAETWKTDATLKGLVDPSAEFDLSRGDVGRPMGKGIEAARKMVLEMPVSSFRYTQWSGIPTPVDGCDKHIVKVSFFNAALGDVVPIEATFRAGVLISAHGWWNAEATGKF